MAKRVRGTATRPGQRPPLQRQAGRTSGGSSRPSTAQSPSLTTPPSVTTSRPASLTPEEEARAAELEAEIVAQERQADAARRTRTQRSTEMPVRASAPLAVAAANEYAYVARDVRRVVTVGGSLIAVLVILWVFTQVTGVTL